MTTIATLLSGGECVGVGAQAAGLSHLWGFELHDDIAAVARDNGFNVITGDVMTLDPATLAIPDVLHASPVCKRASGANQGAELNEDGTKEAPEDVEMGAKIASFIDVMTPRVFTLENVFAYRNFKAFKAICDALSRNGYFWDFDNLNSADYGVPQTRRRLILRAVRGALLPNLPQPVRWVGWYEAIADLIPGLPESRFADWQLERLPGGIKGTMLVHGTNSNGITVNQTDDPSGVIVASLHSKAVVPRAFIAANGKYDTGLVLADESAPVFTVTANSNQTGVRAWLVDDQRTTDGGPTSRDNSEPSFPILAGSNHPVRAWLVDGQNSRTEEKGGLSVYEDGRPAMTVNSAMHGTPRAWLSQGRVVSMSTRALARFQSIPDSYLLPANKRLACTIIGNGVCPLLYQKIIAPLVGS